MAGYQGEQVGRELLSAEDRPMRSQRSCVAALVLVPALFLIGCHSSSDFLTGQQKVDGSGVEGAVMDRLNSAPDGVISAAELRSLRGLKKFS